MTADVAAPYTLRSIEAMLGMSRGAVTRLVQAGCVSPRRGPRNEYRFSFQDVVLLRTAHHLQQAQVPTRRMLRSLRHLRAQLPPGLPITSLRLKAIGDAVAVCDGDVPWEPESGQLLMDFDAAAAPAGSSSSAVAATAYAPTHRAAPKTAAEFFQSAALLEAYDRDTAIAAYRSAIALAPDYTDAYVNLGALLCDAGRSDEALALYERAAALAPDAPHVHFNGALAMEDLGRVAEAIGSYRRCLELAPYLSDAHYNLARLLHKTGDTQGALRHFNAYRRAERGAEPPDA